MDFPQESYRERSDYEALTLLEFSNSIVHLNEEIDVPIDMRATWMPVLKV